MTALILDCDGVLAETERDGHRVAFNRAFRLHGLPLHWDEATYGRLLQIGGGKERLRVGLGRAPETAGLTKGDLEEIIAAVHSDKTQIFVEMASAGDLPARPGVRRVVTQALDADWKVVVASTSAEESVRGVLASAVGADVAASLDGVFAGDIVKHKKPSPEIYERVMRDMHISGGEGVVIEDSGIGAQAAAAAGLGHLVTLSYYTRDDDFPFAAAVMTSLGDARSPATCVTAIVEPRPGSIVDLDDLERCARAVPPREARD